MAIRPAHPQPRPLSDLGPMLGVRLASVGNQFSPNELGSVRGVTLDSRGVQPGDLYVALPGSQVHGATFCAEAVAAGAVFVVADPRAKLGEVACWVYGNPSSRLRLIGVTGTSGKTTSTYLLESGLRAAGHLTGLIGGVETRIGTERLASSLTTPEASDLQALFAVMAERGVTAAAMEVSSHSLTLGRVAGTSFDVAVFTNLSQDHLDFHGDLEEYFRAKASLFLPPVTGVVNLDDKYGRRLASAGASRRTCRSCWPGRSTWPTRSARWWPWSRSVSAWRMRWPGSPRARACLAGWNECPPPGSTSPP